MRKVWKYELLSRLRLTDFGLFQFYERSDEFRKSTQYLGCHAYWLEGDVVEAERLLSTTPELVDLDQRILDGNRYVRNTVLINPGDKGEAKGTKND